MPNLFTLEDYKRITAETLSSAEEEHINAMIEVVIDYITGVLGYSLEIEEREEYREEYKKIFLRYRPVSGIISVKRNDKEIPYFVDHNKVEISVNDCICCNAQNRISIKYKSGFEELPNDIKYMIVQLIKGFIDGLSEEQRKYSNYKIDEISYSFNSYIENNQATINQIIQRLY